MRRGAILALLLIGCARIEAAAGPPQAQVPQNSPPGDFFESHIRPILAENCFSCHGAKHHQGGLRLDSRQAMLQGNESGPAVAAGDAEKSPLIHAIRQDGKIKMPPAPRKKLPPESIEALTTWVNRGLPWPEETTPQVATTRGPTPAANSQHHWAFQPVRNPALPTVKSSTWASSPVDRFILAKLEEKGLSPSTPADRRSLIRRATFDLTGLPPTAEEVSAFENDPAPDAFARVIDRLLASPRYGERWGRYWLDVARYADTKGYVFTQERNFACSWTYRDYVIQAFNQDLPYDRFVIQQLAADRLNLGEDKGPLAALGYLTLGSRFMNNPHDIIDDRIDVVCRGMLGLTVTCARCHDHKFDPIPTRDYYSLYGVFASSTEPDALPIIGVPRKTAAYLTYEKEVRAREEKLAQFRRDKHAEATAEYRARVGEYLLAAQGVRQQPRMDEFMFVAGVGEVNPLMVQRWQRFLTATRQAHHPVFAPWNAFAALPDKEFASSAGPLAAQFAANKDPSKPINPLVAQAFAGKPPTSLQEVADRYARVFAEVDKVQAGKTASGGKEMDPAQEQLRQVLHGKEAPPAVPLEEIDRFLLDRASRNKLNELRRDIDHFKGASLDAPPRAMALVDKPAPYDPHVFTRGNPNKVGEAVPRQFLEVLAGAQRQPFQQGSGRLELAQAIVQKSNPLTARVLVNRLWLHHFGTGLVTTPSDFGLRSDPPSHPELLDYLAWQFMDEGWSIKKLHRLIMLSSVYQQASTDNPQGRQVDPENRLLWKMNRRRLDFEAMRDALLAVGGNIDPNMGGRPVRLETSPFPRRRTVYGFIDRQNVPNLFRTFDFPAPDATNPQRYQTTVPLQALFLMNSPFVVEEARALITRPEVANQPLPQERIQVLYHLVYGRGADEDEVAIGMRFLSGQEHRASDGSNAARTMPGWDQYAQALLLSNEFAYID